MKEITINIQDYLSDDELKQIVIEETRNNIRYLLKDEKNASRILSNLSYNIVYDEIDKIIPESRELVIKQTMGVLNDIKSYSVFRDNNYGGTKSIGQQILDGCVLGNKDLINEKVKETITNKDYSEEIWRKFEELGETFIDNIYTIVALGRKGKQ